MVGTLFFLLTFAMPNVFASKTALLIKNNSNWDIEVTSEGYGKIEIAPKSVRLFVTGRSLTTLLVTSYGKPGKSGKRPQVGWEGKRKFVLGTPVNFPEDFEKKFAR